MLHLCFEIVRNIFGFRRRFIDGQYELSFFFFTGSMLKKFMTLTYSRDSLDYVVDLYHFLFLVVDTCKSSRHFFRDLTQENEFLALIFDGLKNRCVGFLFILDLKQH